MIVDGPVAEIMYGRLGRLRDTYRYSAQPVINRENVAEHSFWTAIISSVVAMSIGLEQEHVWEVSYKSIIHDIEECMTGDLVRDMKYADPSFRDAVLEIEQRFLGSLLEPLGTLGIYIYDDWTKSKDSTLSGRIVSLSDALSVISYCHKEKELGNEGLKEIRDACADLIRRKFYDDEDLGDVAKAALVPTFRRWPR